MSYLFFAGLLLAAGLLGGHFWLLFALGWLGSKLLQKIRERRRLRKLGLPTALKMPEESAAMTELSAEPDSPVPFGYKMEWMAVRCSDPEWVISELSPVSRQPANWKTGIARAYEDRTALFVSPCLDGWVLVIGLAADMCTLYDPDDMDIWGGCFPEVQFFATHRVSEYHRWGTYRNGVCVRDCCCVDNMVQWEEGELTPEELALGFERFSPDGAVWPGEEDVLSIAAAWGIDPKFEKKTYPPGTGWLCTVG